MFHSAYERITYLEYQLKAKNDIIAAFESEARYVKMQEEHCYSLRRLERKIKKLEWELEAAHRDNRMMRKNWMDVFEDLEKEMAKMERAFQKEIKKLAQKLLRTEQELDSAKEKIKHLQSLQSTSCHQRKYWKIQISNQQESLLQNNL